MNATPGARAWARFRANRGALVGSALVLLALFSSLLAPLLAPHNPDLQIGPRVLTAAQLPAGPSWEFPLGVDTLMRCELSRLLYGGRVSLTVALVSTLLLTVVGTTVGVVAGYFGRWVDTVLMRLVDVLLAFPFLLVVMALNTAIARPGLWVLFLVLGFLSWTGLARQVRAQVLRVRELEYVQAARALGAGSFHILRRHVLPNITSLIVVVATSMISELIIVESVLSYLGVGVVPPTSSWGSMLHEGEGLLRLAPRLTLVPGLAIMLTVVGFNLVGEGLRDAFDPKG